MSVLPTCTCTPFTFGTGKDANHYCPRHSPRKPLTMTITKQAAEIHITEAEIDAAFAFCITRPNPADSMREVVKRTLEFAQSRQASAQGGERVEPVWIVNSLGELGVKVGDRLFFLYKGGNIEYGDPEVHSQSHKDGVVFDEEAGRPMLYRIVGKREFGETQWPAKWLEAGRREDRYTEELVWHEGLSDGKKEDGDWRPIPVATPPATSGMKEPSPARAEPINKGKEFKDFCEFRGFTPTERELTFFDAGFMAATGAADGAEPTDAERFEKDVAFWMERGHTREQAETEVRYRANRSSIKGVFSGAAIRAGKKG